MPRSLLVATLWLAGTQVVQAQPQTSPPPTSKSLENRVQELENELQRMKLQAEEEPETPAAPQATGVSSNVLNPTLTVVGNGLFRYDDLPVGDVGARVDKTFNLREVELDLRAAIDPFADGVVIIAFPSASPGQISVEVEEGYVTIKRLPIPIFDDPPLGLKLKLGRFRTEVGRINRLHLHDLPQVNRPLATDEWFGEDGFIANGISAQVFLPFFDEESALELTVQALAGGGAALAEGPARTPAFVGNLRWFRTFGGDHSFDLSLIFHFGRTDPAGDLHAFTYSADFLYKWKPLRRGEYRSFVLGGQVFYSRRDFAVQIDTNGDGVPDLTETHSAAPFGWFAFAQYQLTRSTYLGVRYDDTATINDDGVRRRGVQGSLSWYLSEFLRLRLAYEHRFSDLAVEDGRNSVFAEVNFIFGAHPPEPFWVNK